MEAGIEIDIAVEIHVLDIAAQSLVDPLEQALQFAQPRRGNAPFGGQPQRQTF
ncbi:hypothetical protein D9M68_1001730 [compost metagenome]